MIKADLHVHTCYSVDCNTPLEGIVDQCLKIGLNCLAVADHNTISGALKLREIAPFKVIIAEEIMTSMGELIGLFLSEEVPKGLSPEETIARIKSQGGLVGIPHPYGRPPSLLARSRRNNLLSPEIVSQVDIIEVLNSRNFFPNSSSKAWRLALKYKLPASAGSDAHTLGEIGRAYVEVPEFNSPTDFLDSLSRGKISGHRSNPLVHFASIWAKVNKRFRGV
ncbi:MAG: PHP domain-containing protein [Dehalococcoidia bacterium]|nr:PHP domain-containing protein [Dehalococcoidia bacterium]